MLFNSFSFFVFFPIVTFFYFLLPHRLRWIFLLFVSCVFYMSFIPAYILILAFLILVDYTAARYIENAQGSRRKAGLLLSIFATCLILCIFKYFDFINSNLSAIAHFFNIQYPTQVLKLILPIGLSFHTFQSLSYVIDVYRGKAKAERHLGIYALYVMFYPQLVAGPIERPGHLLPQFRQVHLFEYQRVTDGLKLMAWGLFKKMVVADQLAPYVNAVYQDPRGADGSVLILVTVFFAFQIYGDFSGYTDIARGSAKVMGFNLMENFRRPYFSTSVGEFWRRWHISLSSWFRDYVYVSLGGNRLSRPRLYLNIFLTFLLSGLWHGANWTFVVWGALNGFYLIFSHLTRPVREKMVSVLGLNKVPLLHQLLQMTITFCLITFAWIFFRAQSLDDAFYIITHLFKAEPYALDSKIYLVLFFILIMEAVHILQEKGRAREMLTQQPFILRWALYYLLVFLILLSGVFEQRNFIYFQF